MTDHQFDTHSSFKEKWSDAWEDASKKLEENNKKLKEAFKEIKENYSDQNRELNELLDNLKNGKESSSIKKYLLGSTHYDKYATQQKYNAQRDYINNDSSLTDEQKSYGLGFIDSKESEDTAATKATGLIQDTMDVAVDSFSDGLQKMILGYQDFKTTMQQIGSELTTYLLKQITDLAFQSLFSVNNAKAAGSAASATGSWGSGFFGAVGGIFKGIFGKHHSGGVIPSGANYSLPGTQEQLALLKGGERVLSPSENVSYNDSQGGGSPVVLNNFNIKAWDSKDVRKYLMENRELLNQITFEGIKNNNCQLRNMVKGA